MLTLSTVRRAIINALTQIQLLICHGLLATMLLAIILQIAGRSFGFGIDVTVEVARFSFVAVVFVAAGYTSIHGAHLSITFLIDMTKENSFIRRFLNATIFIVTISLDGLLLYLSIYGLIDGLSWSNTSPVLGLNVAYLYLAPIIGFSCSILTRLISMQPIHSSLLSKTTSAQGVE